MNRYRPDQDSPSWDKEPIFSTHQKCKNKRIFLNWDKAEHHAKKVRRNKDRRMEPYRCRFCRGIHVGSNDNAGVRKKKRRKDKRWAYLETRS